MPIKQEKPLWILLRSGYFYVQKMAKPLVNQGFSKKKISTADFINRAVEIWQGQKDLNPRHPVLETGVLPTELYPCDLAIISQLFPFCKGKMKKR